MYQPRAAANGALLTGCWFAGETCGGFAFTEPSFSPAQDHLVVSGDKKGQVAVWDHQKASWARLLAWLNAARSTCALARPGKDLQINSVWVPV
jgi:hypothetical protein